jgi:carbamoyltransferase
MYTLGINAAFHDSSACLVDDHIVIAAAEEERFTGVKHGKRPVPFSAYELPYHAIHFCLEQAAINLCEVDHIAYSFNPDLFSDLHNKYPSVSLPLKSQEAQGSSAGESVWDPLFLLSIIQAPSHLVDGVPHHLKKRFVGVNESLGQWHFVDHHLAHAASAFFVCPFKNAAVLTLDGRGEKATTSYYKGEGYDLELIKQINMPHSLGILYERLTTHLGFLHSSDEYKVMALASFGKPKFVREFRDIISVNNQGEYAIKDVDFTKYFGPPRQKGEEFKEEHFDIAHSLQLVLEETVLKLVHWLHEETHMENLCLAGGVALNCVLNARLRDQGPFKNIWVQPAAGDAGTALGAALVVDHQESEYMMNGSRAYVMEHAYLGPEFGEDEIENFLRWAKVPYERLNNVAKETAELLVQDKVIGWFQGRMEFGPRALGARSIIASPLHAHMQARLNEIKDREDFRPVAPVVLEEEAKKWFMNADTSAFMLFIYDVYLDKVKEIPAVCHVDRTARIQTIRRTQNPIYYDVIKAFEKKTGVPILINTSFNTRGKPIVCTPKDALECFWTSPMDALVIGPFLIRKEGHNGQNFSGGANA